MNRDLKIVLSIIGVSILLFVPFIGRLHLFDWDEINFAESAREMLATGDYLTVKIFFEPFWEKPPLFIWLQALSMHVFGVNEFAARFPNSVVGIITLVVFYLLGKRLINERFGIIWSLAYAASVLPFLYFKSGIIDPWFNLFIFLGVVFYIFAQKSEIVKKKYIRILLSAFFIGLAVLTKGPAAILIFGLAVFVLLLLERFKLHLKFGQVLAFIFMLSFVGGFWFILQIINGNWETVVEFVVYQIRLFQTEDAGHGGFPFYHFVVLFFGVFPASVYAIYAHKKSDIYDNKIAYFRKGMIILFWVVLILFSIVKTKIVHYSSLCYFPISFLAAYSIYALLTKNKKLPKWMAILQIFSASIYALLVMLFPFFDKNKQVFIDRLKNNDPFTAGNLQAQIDWYGWEWMIGVLLIVGFVISIILIKKGSLKKGFIFQAVTSILFIYLTIIFITPKVEKISQNTAIEFLKSKQGKDVYVGTMHKSYAMLFYTRPMPSKNPNAFNLSWLLTGDIDKEAYFVARNNKLEEYLNRYKDLEFLYEKNGYVFLKRSPKIINKEKDD